MVLSRRKRDLFGSNKDRECGGRKNCRFEEYVEAKENETKRAGLKIRSMTDNKKNTFDARVEIYFNHYYVKCIELELQAHFINVDEPAVRRGCLANLDKRLDIDGVFRHPKRPG